jgi:hypothetical protein
MDRPVPYVNHALLPKHMGQTVRLICKPTTLPINDAFQAEAVDHGSVTISLQGISLPSAPYLCVTGTVNRDLSISAKALDTFGTKPLDMENANAMIGLMQSTPSLFT